MEMFTPKQEIPEEPVFLEKKPLKEKKEKKVEKKEKEWELNSTTLFLTYPRCDK